MLVKLLVRDIAIAVVVLTGWWVAWPLDFGTGPIADVVGVLLGLGAGALAYLGHEWGHLAGALATRSHVAAAPRVTALFLFSFDSKTNSQAQFLVMSLSGFAVTGVAFYVAYGVLPDGPLAVHVLRGLVVFSAGLTVLLEVPLLTISLLRGSILEQAEVFPVDRETRR